MKDDFEVSDEMLVQACQRELPYAMRAYETLVRRHEPSVFQACHYYLSSREEAEEASQDVMLKIYHGIQGFRMDSTFKTWLYTIVNRVCATRYSRMKTRNRREVDQMQMKSPEVNLTSPKTADQTLQEKDRLAQAMSRLPKEDRHAIILRHVLGLSFIEMSEVLDATVSAVKMRLYRAEAKFRELQI